jgi:hypothetical protein
MSISLILASFWVLAATVVAMMPMRMQFIPGIGLLTLSVPLLGYVGWQHGGWIVLLVLLGVLSMFRRPLFYFTKKVFGRVSEVSE